MRAQVGNGPFQFSSIVEDQQIDFVRNENYWNPAKVDGLSFIYIEDSSVALEAYKQGQLDILTPDASQIPAIKEDPELAALVADEVGRAGSWMTPIDDPYLPIHYPTTNLLPFLQGDERWVEGHKPVAGVEKPSEPVRQR